MTGTDSTAGVSLSICFSEIFNTAGGIGLFVDAKDQAAKSCYEQFGFVSLPSNGLELFLPVKTIQDALTQRDTFACLPVAPHIP